MNPSSSRWIEPRQVTSLSHSDATPSSFNQISNLASGIMNGRVLCPKIASGVAGNPLSTNDLSPQAFLDNSSTDVLSLPETQFSGQIERRGHRLVQRQSHTKSRTGCLNCKTRRIKCGENRPSCTQCEKRRLQCRWPDLQIRDARATIQISSSGPLSPVQLQSAEATFTMQDFRLFYHFIQKAYPHHPIGNDSVWTHEIPSISHNYDYLMHAMLGLSASDITEKVTKSSELTCSAMSHRLQAIKSLNNALSNGLQTFEEGNAMLATCYVLLFQSVLLEDGLTEYMLFIRGCALIAQNMGCKRMKFLFHSFIGMSALTKMDPHLKESPEVNPRPVSDGCRSLQGFEHLCHRDYEIAFHNSLFETALALHTSSRNAYIGLMRVYQTFAHTMSQEDFNHYTDPKNEVGQVLQAHFVAVQLLLSPITVHELGDREPDAPNNISIRWLGAIFERITPQMRGYVKWPMSVAEGVRTGSFYTEISYNSPSTLRGEGDVSSIVSDET